MMSKFTVKYLMLTIPVKLQASTAWNKRSDHLLTYPARNPPVFSMLSHSHCSVILAHSPAVYNRGLRRQQAYVGLSM